MVRYQVLATGGVFDHTVRSVVAPNLSSQEWKDYQSWLTAGNTPLPPSTVGSGSLEETKAQRCSEIDAYAAGLRNLAVRGRSAAEMATWTAKLVEARAYLVAPVAASAPLLNDIATVRAITLAALVDKVMAQATPFLTLEAYIDGIRGKHCDGVAACTTVADVAAYNWSTEWPTVT